MTFLQPNKENSALISRIIAILALPAVLGIIALVILHNQFVGLKHDLSEMNLETQETQASNADIKDQILDLFSNETLLNFKNSRGLIQEKKPSYFQTNKQWASAL